MEGRRMSSKDFKIRIFGIEVLEKGKTGENFFVEVVSQGKRHLFRSIGDRRRAFFLVPVGNSEADQLLSERILKEVSGERDWRLEGRLSGEGHS